MKVKMLENGICYDAKRIMSYSIGDILEMPESVLRGLSKQSYLVLSRSPNGNEEKVEIHEEKALEKPKSDRQVKKSKNKSL